MPRSPSTGQFTLDPVYLAIAGQPILTTQWNQTLVDIQTVLNEAWPFDVEGDVLAPDGLVSLPSITFASDLDTGFYRIGTNNFGASAAGAKVLDIGTTGLTVTGTLNATTTAAGPIATLTSTDAGAGPGPDLYLDRNSASPAANDQLGAIRWTARSSTGAQFIAASILPILLDPTNTTEDVGMQISLRRNGLAQQYLILGYSSAASGTLGDSVALNLGQLSFPAVQNPSSDANTLDDYKQGVFTPAFSASGATFSYAGQTGIYTKVGNEVSVMIRIALNNSGNTLTANPLTITGLPYALSGIADMYFPIDWFASTTSYVKMSGLLASGGTTLAVQGITAAGTSGVGALNSSAALHATNSSAMWLAFTYMTT